MKYINRLLAICLIFAGSTAFAGSPNPFVFRGKQIRGFWYAPESCSFHDTTAFNANSKRYWRCNKDDTLPQAVMMYYTFPDNCVTNNFTVKVRFSALQDIGKFACFYAAYEVATDGVDWDAVPQSTIDTEGQSVNVELTQTSGTQYEATITNVEAFDVLAGDTCANVAACENHLGVLYLERRRTPDCTNNSTNYIDIHEVEPICQYY